MYVCNVKDNKWIYRKHFVVILCSAYQQREPGSEDNPESPASLPTNIKQEKEDDDDDDEEEDDGGDEAEDNETQDRPCIKTEPMEMDENSTVMPDEVKIKTEPQVRWDLPVDIYRVVQNKLDTF